VLFRSPYQDPKGKPLKAHPKWPDFYRVRYLGKDGSFKGQTQAKESRYTQPANTGVCAYLPPIVDWEAIRKDAAETILITEGELKAAKATAEGFPTIGLGGVYNFRSAKQGVFFLPELEAFTWARRRVIIVYDSDYQTNANVCAAINILAEELAERGALVAVGLLENVYDGDDTKTGLDDFLVERGEDALIKVLEESEPLTMSRRLWQMNDEVVYVEDPGFVVAQGTGQKLPVSNFSQHSRWATSSVPERKVLASGSVSIAKSQAAPVWLRWPLRKAVSKLTYMPGQSK